MNVPSIPAWFVAAIAAIYAGVVLWQIFGRRAIIRSKDQEQLDLVMSTGVEEIEGPRPEVQDELSQAGLHLTQESFQMLRLAGVVLGVVVIPVLGFPLLLGLFVAVAAWFGSRWWVRERIRGRGLQIEKELPTALSRLAALILIINDTPQLLLTVAESLTSVNPKSPLAQEFRATAVDFRERKQKAFEALEDRAPAPSLATLAFDMRTYDKAGGTDSAAQMMADSARRLQRIIEGRNKARAKAASAMMMAKILPLLLAGGTFFVMQDPIIRRFFFTSLGQLVMLAVAGSMLFGYQFIKKMVEEVA